MRVACAATVVAAALLLTACGDGDEPSDTVSTATPSGTVETPSASPAADDPPSEPPLPDAATRATEAGARAFITYYWDLINYAQVTGDVKALRQASGPNCDGCSRGVRGIAALYRSGGHLEGGSYTLKLGPLAPLKSASASLYAFEARVTVRTGRQRVVRPEGTEINNAGRSTLGVAVAWTADNWRIEALELL